MPGSYAGDLDGAAAAMARAAAASAGAGAGAGESLACTQVLLGTCW